MIILIAMAILYIVATPIGNLEDISLRAIRILQEVDVIACEDTRHTLKLLNHLGIKKPLVACYAYDEEKGVQRIVSLLKDGKNVAYCSDAGTPGLSDPGIMAAEQARKTGFEVVPIPGASAFAALVSAAGIYYKSVLFEGFLPVKPGKRKARLQELMNRPEAFLLYESPYRIIKLLTDIADIEAERNLCVGREMTKLHEEFICSSAIEAKNALLQKPALKGEFSVLVSGAKKE